MIGLVQRHRIRQVQHVDLFELTLGAVVGSHHIEREIADVHDSRIALSDPTGLHDEETAACGAQNQQRVVHDGGEFRPRVAGGQAPHEHLRTLDRVESDAIPEERAAGTPLRGIHRDNSYPAHRSRTQIRPLSPEPEQQLVEDRALSRSSRTGDPQHGSGRADVLRERGPVGAVEPLRLRKADQPGGRAVSAKRIVTGEILEQFAEGGRRAGGAGFGGVPQHVGHDAFDAGHPIVPGGIDPGHPVVFEGGRFLGADHPPAATKDPDVVSPRLPEQIDEVAEELVVPPLVRGHRDGVRIFLERGGGYLSGGPVVPEVNNLGATPLQQSAEHMDRGVVTVKQRGSRDEAKRKLHQRVERDPRGRRSGREQGHGRAQLRSPRHCRAAMAAGNGSSWTVALRPGTRGKPTGPKTPNRWPSSPHRAPEGAPPGKNPVSRR